MKLRTFPNQSECALGAIKRHYYPMKSIHKKDKHNEKDKDSSNYGVRTSADS